MSAGRTDPLKLSPRPLVEDFRAGRRDPRELLQSVYAQIAAHGERPVWISLLPLEQALSMLDSAERRGRELPLFGVPFAVKDNIDVAGLETTAACPEFAYVAKQHAGVVERLVHAGAIPIGKTNLDQFATGLVGTRTPYGACSSVFDSRYISGGSSSGSAVAVARGDVSFALGTDTAGSGRVPAAFNELVGVKPTRGLLSARGLVPACRSLDCISIFARDLVDAEALLGIAAGYDAADPFSRQAPTPPPAPKQFRIGVPSAPEFFGDSESQRLFEAAVDGLARRGAQIAKVDMAPFHATAALLYHGPWVAERLAAVGSFYEQHASALQPVLRAILEGGQRFTAKDAFEGSYRLAELRRQVEPIWNQIDALLVPTAPTHYTLEQIEASPIELNTRLGTYTNFVNLLDLSGLAVPAGRRDSGLPFGVTYLAPAFREAHLFALARFALGEPTATSITPEGIEVAVAGAHLSGQPLNEELTRRGAELVRTTRTSASYRLFALKTTPPKPGLVYVGPGKGAPLEVEVWRLSPAEFGHFVQEIPQPMGIGSTELEDGTRVKGFICEPYALDDAEDITSFGGWRAFRTARSG
ncbi:MAG: allophanate hydrolase [Polyangiaceae bacterium]